MSQLYSLRWNNHQPNFISVFTSMMNTETLVDVTLAAEGKHLRAHKVVLCSCSSYFHSLLVDNPSSHPIVILKDVAYADLRIIVDFMYCGSVNVTEQQLQQVLETAKLLMIRGLSDHESTTSVARPASNVNTAAGNASTSAPSCSLGTNTTLSTNSSAGISAGSSSILSVGASSILSAGPSARPSADTHGDSMDSPINSPMTSPARKRRRRRRSSGTPTNLNVAQEEHRRSTSSDMNTQHPVDNVPVVSVQLQRRVDMQQETDDVNEDQNNSMNAPQDASTAQGQWSMMEHSYPRYSNACFAGSLQPDPAMYINNVIPHMDADINYGQSLGVPGPSCVDVQNTPEQVAPAVPKRRRTTNPQSEENFQRALEAVRFGGIGFCKAARMFGVNNRTLWLEYKKKGYPNNRPSIKSRIKREHTTPPPEQKEDIQQPEQQMALICQQHQVPPGFIDTSTSHGFNLQSIAHNSPLNILGVNFNSMQ